MHRISRLLILLALTFSGCQNEPQVVSTSPADGATDVAIDVVITATFNGNITNGNANQATFTVAGPDGDIEGEVDSSGDTATFTPAVPLNAAMTYTATVAPKHGHGNQVDPYSWSFTTRPRTWTAAAQMFLGTTSTTDVQCAIDRHGNAITVWKSFSGPWPTTSFVWASMRPTGGAWSSPVELSQGGFGGDYPKVAMDPAGNAIVAWVKYPIMYSTRYDLGAGWGPVEIASTGSTASVPHDLVIDDAGASTVVWTDNTHRVVTNRHVPGTGWGTPFMMQEDNRIVIDSPPKLAVSESGIVACTWSSREYSDSTRVFCRMSSQGAGWSYPHVFPNGSALGGDADVGIDAGGTVTVVFSHYQPTRRIAAIHFHPGTGWTPILELSVAGQGVQEAKTAVAANGNAVAIWPVYYQSSTRLEGSYYTPATGWSGPVFIENPFVGGGYHEVAIDAAGNAIAIWEAGSNFSKVYINRYEVGQGWSANFRLDGLEESVDYPKIAMNPRGAAVAAWLQANPPGHSMVGVYSASYE